ncbi:hypothetical protein [Amycolatopsis suaedae]|uniref:Uncharacterized protein n=1 Tax=Amycolatopsis suaedae TaxID=2510978 RepID=A0A4Q7IWR5_9PSEU|nr:hypothetical protein [Amycolatopsis suaedae]RZQ59381.1 hypothetical protein EWH70_34265 [Amycolatopsis suaedae]
MTVVEHSGDAEPIAVPLEFDLPAGWTEVPVGSGVVFAARRGSGPAAITMRAEHRPDPAPLPDIAGHAAGEHGSVEVVEHPVLGQVVWTTTPEVTFVHLAVAGGPDRVIVEVACASPGRSSEVAAEFERFVASLRTGED